MRVTMSKKPADFAPRKIEIVFETQLELDLFGSLFNSSEIAKRLRDNGLEPRKIYSAIENADGVIFKYCSLFNCSNLKP